jgi:hypothetical protein
LNDKSEHHYSDEKPVVEESFENVDLVSQFSTVNLVEDLHENKRLEDYCVDYRFV